MQKILKKDQAVQNAINRISKLGINKCFSNKKSFKICNLILIDDSESYIPFSHNLDLKCKLSI